MDARRTITAVVFIIALVASLTLASCIGQKPNASLLASDISKLGFIPGKPVTMPPGFKAECSMQPNSPQFKAFGFKNGFYIIDAEDGNRFGFALLFSPKAPMSDEATKKAQGIIDTSIIIGPKIPDSQQSSITYTTYEGKDVYSLTWADVIHAYGPPSKAVDRNKKAADYSKGLGQMLEYVFRVGEDDYQVVRFLYSQEGSDKEYLWGVGVVKFSPSKNDPLSDYKVYAWPDLYPTPGNK